MNEENLATLFSDLPKQCVVLLEDIDTAGLTHTRQAPNQDEDAKSEKSQTSGTITRNSANSSPPNGGRISLSALLNFVDGVAATEGRILIMTTNHLEKLDAALIRPGRVDMIIKFDLATTYMVTTIFRGIFATLEGDVPKIVKNGVVIRSPKRLELVGSRISKPQQEDEDNAKEDDVNEAKRGAEEAKIFELGARFAEIIPAMTFSPAELQGYLLKHKREPELAVQNAAEWVNTRKAEQVRDKVRLEKEEKEKTERDRLEKDASEKEKKDEDKPRVNDVEAGG